MIKQTERLWKFYRTRRKTTQTTPFNFFLVDIPVSKTTQANICYKSKKHRTPTLTKHWIPNTQRRNVRANIANRPTLCDPTGHVSRLPLLLLLLLQNFLSQKSTHKPTHRYTHFNDDVEELFSFCPTPKKENPLVPFTSRNRTNKHSTLQQELQQLEGE